MTLPLAGRRVVVTREEPPDGPLARALRERGAEVLTVPCTTTAPPADPAALHDAVGRASSFDWLLVTSARTVAELPDPLPAGPPPRWAAVGEASARALRERGVEAETVGSGTGADLARLLGDLSGRTVLLPASDRVRPETVAALEAAGASVTTVPAYRTLARDEAPAELRRCLTEGVDALTFTSPSAAEALGPPPEGIPLPKVAAIGESTAGPLAAAGWRDLVLPGRPELDALAEALARSFATAEE